jgi:carboxyl-terminal processing protease
VGTIVSSMVMSSELYSNQVDSRKTGMSPLYKIVFSLLLLVCGMFVQHKYHLVERVIQDSATIQSTDSYVSIGKPQNTSAPEFVSDADFGIFWEVWDILDRDYVDHTKLDATKMVDGAVSGMTAALDDPYTAYLPPKVFERVGQELAGAFYGVGIELGYKEKVLAVVAPLPDTPAGNANVEPGDLIVHVKDDQKSLDADSGAWSLQEAMDAIRGPKDSKVTLTLIREGESAPIEVTLTRAEIVVKSVKMEVVERNGKKVAHIKLMRFGERTMAEWDALVSEILKQRTDLAGVVLDMRGNPGGLFDDAVEIASEFIKDGVVVSEQGKTSKRDFKVTGQARLSKVPVVVLVNGGSASASEIVAGALRDRLNVKLIGEKTFGKGTVQDRRDLSNGGGIHITISKWLLPAGDWIHETGIDVSVEVKDDPKTEIDEQLEKAIEEL